MISARAPGKALLIGEYAVLDGASAWVMALDMGIACEAHHSSAPRKMISSKGTEFVEAALDFLSITQGVFYFYEYNMPTTPSKLGIGSSASATVAALLAGCALSGLETTSYKLFQDALHIHHQVQGSGSGVDVAACCFGGCLRYAKQQVLSSLCFNTPYSLIWTGSSAQTGPKIAQYLQWNINKRHAFVNHSEHICEYFPQDPIQALKESHHLLCHMSQETGILYETPESIFLTEQAQQLGGYAKPSGAGGGDLMIALFSHTETQHQFEAICHQSGFLVLSTHLSEGARLYPS